MPDAIRAKVYVREIARTRGYQGDNEKVSFAFVAGNDINTENYRFFKATPSGDFWMNIDNPDAQGFFELGQEYYVDLTPAE